MLAALAVGVGAAAVGPSLSVAGTAPHSQSARAKYVSGRLNLSGYTVVVVGYNGTITSSRSQTFRLAAPTADVTVQLISPKGVYAGPVVFGGSSSRAITGVKAGTSLGTIDVLAAKGYARLARKLPSKDLDASRWAYASHGVPLGNGRNLGLVKGLKGKSNGGTGPGQDEAHVGIPNEFDIAVPGTHIIKDLAPIKIHKGKAADVLAGPETLPHEGLWALQGGFTSGLKATIQETVNDDAAGVTLKDINTEMQADLSLGIVAPFASASLVTLSCNGLSYCSEPNSTGQVLLSNGGSAPFPSASDGEIVGPSAPGDFITDRGSTGEGVDDYSFAFKPHATYEQIGSGDVLTENVTTDGVGPVEIPNQLGFVFATVPALASYSDTAGDSGTITYPDEAELGAPNQNGFTDGGRFSTNPIRVAAGANGEVVLTVTLYRPQRPGITTAGEPTFMDIGHLGYAFDVNGQCLVADYSSTNHSPTLTLAEGPQGAGGGPNAGGGLMVDSASEQPAPSANTISFTINLTKCMAARGITFSVGHQQGVSLVAATAMLEGGTIDQASQEFVVERTK